MIVVIPVHNQARNLFKVLHGYLKQTVMPKHLILVLDRCTDNSIDVAAAFKVNFEVRLTTLHVIDTKDYANIVGFGAGRTRDVGIAYALANEFEGNFLFSDGDCIPSEKLVEHHERQLAVENPRVTCGLRYETVPNGEKISFPLIEDSNINCNVQDDLRTNADYCKNRVFGEGYDRLVLDHEIFERSWICWSCNLGMNRAAINLCKIVNGMLSGDVDRVFNSDFDGRWGGEDGFVGLTIYRCGGETVALSRESHVTHIWHQRSHTNNDHMIMVYNKDTQLKQAIINERVPADISVVESIIPAASRDFNIHVMENIADYFPSAVIARVLTLLPDSMFVTAAVTLISSGFVLFKGSTSGTYFEEPRDFLDVECEKARMTAAYLTISVHGSEYGTPIPLDFQNGEQA